MRNTIFNIIIIFLSAFIRDKESRKKFRRKYKRNPYVINRCYGKIYMPYCPSRTIGHGQNKVYNKNGQELDVCFLREIFWACPQGGFDHFMFDRYNIALDKHVYTHSAMLETMGHPKERYGALIESETIRPEQYEIFDSHKGLEKDFDLIFTYSAKLLDQLDNAVFIPFEAEVWNREAGTKNLNEGDVLSEKNKNISILSSDKQMCDLHKYRFALAQRCKNERLADTYGTFDGGPMVLLQDTLRNYRYSICIENDIKPYFFTERLTTALFCKTVPIYMGATEIDKFFNPDGIIKLNKNEDIAQVLKQCTKEEYERRLPAIEENYEMAKKYRNFWDFIYVNYFNGKRPSKKENISDFVRRLKNFG